MPFLTPFLVAQKNPTKEDILKLIRISEEELVKLNFEKSLKVAKTALTYSFQIKDDVSIAHCYNEIAGNYEELAQFDKALEYYVYSLRYAKKAKNLTIQDFIYNNRANIYFFEQKRYELGIENYKKAIACSQKIKDFRQVTFTKANLAWAYFTIKENKNAFECLEYINVNKKYFKEPWSVANLEMLNAMGFAARNDIDNANIYFLKSIDRATKNNLEIDLLAIYEVYSDFLSSIQDFENAYIYRKKQCDLKEKTYKNKFLANAQIIAENIDIEVYKNEYIRSETENKSQKALIKKTSIINVLFGAFLIVLVLFLLVVYRNNNIRLKNNKVLVLKNSELEIANIKAVESSNLKSQFVSTISHELRTPLYGVIGITNMLLDEQSAPIDEKHLKSLEFSANYLLSLVNDILHINKIEEQEFTLINQDFEIKEEIELIINALSFSSENNNNIIKVTIDEKIPRILIGDKKRLNQIIINLLGNALKFTKNGVVTIDANLVSKSEKSCFINIKISDNGVGIAKEDQEKIFDKFVQVGTNNSDYKGTGLGLSIVKKLIELFDSEIILESKLGVGTSFNFAIEFEIQNDDSNDLIALTQKSDYLKLNVLVVEDNKINQLVTKKIIEKFNSTCVIAEDGFQAIELLKTQTFDIILMDINMPNIDGFETSKLIREKGIKTPIIALTAYSKSEIIDKATASGIDDILIKPFEPMKLCEIVHKQLGKKC